MESRATINTPTLLTAPAQWGIGLLKYSRTIQGTGTIENRATINIPALFMALAQWGVGLLSIYRHDLGRWHY